MTPEFFSGLTRQPAGPPKLFIVVDTEEEFDWSAPYSRDNVGVTAIAEVGRLQAVVGEYGLKPTYVIDYPVASTSASAQVLRGFAERSECHIGAHLHPWVSPPYVEALGTHNSYACNLGYEIEREKIARLKAAIEANLGLVPRAYKAGRYGFAESTARVLEELGFEIDVSVNPCMDFRSDGGPNFEGFSARPGWFGQTRRMLELPCTTGFVGAARSAGRQLHHFASAPWLTSFRAVGILSRTGLVNKVMLSPEGSTYDEMTALTRALVADGVRTFALTFHSPSLKPGCTRYVRTTAERDEFLRTIDRYCTFFMQTIGGTATTPADLYEELGRAD